MEKYEVKFSEEESGYMLEEENEYSGDKVHWVTVTAKTWEDSFTEAKNAFYESNPNANRIYNFTSNQI